MKYLKTPQEIEKYIGGLFEWAKTQQALVAKLRSINISLKLSYREPEAYIVVDCTKDPPEWRMAKAEDKADVEFQMDADVSHKFWLGKLNLPLALMKKEVVAKGPVMKIMGMLPVLNPLFERYKQILIENGRADLLNV